MPDAWSFQRFWWRLLQRHGALTRQLDHILCMNPDCRPRRTGAYTGGAAFQARAHITFDRGLRGLRRFHAPQALEQRERRFLLRHLDDAVRAVLLTVTAPDAGFIDEDFAVGQPMDGRGRTIPHAMRMFAVPAGCRLMQCMQRRAGAAIESRDALVSGRAGLL